MSSEEFMKGRVPDSEKISEARLEQQYLDHGLALADVIFMSPTARPEMGFMTEEFDRGAIKKSSTPWIERGSAIQLSLTQTSLFRVPNIIGRLIGRDPEPVSRPSYVIAIRSGDYASNYAYLSTDRQKIKFEEWAKRPDEWQEFVEEDHASVIAELQHIATRLGIDTSKIVF